MLSIVRRTDLVTDQAFAGLGDAGAVDIDPHFLRPLPRFPLKITGGWYDDRDHAGVDVTVDTGTPIYSIQQGTVKTADANAEGSSGKHIEIVHPSGWATRYLHLSKVFVTAGQVIGAGHLIGLSGDTGLSRNPHLHLDVMVRDDLLPYLERAVGRVRTGYFSRREIGGVAYVAVPGEPWVPADDYVDRVIEGARKYRIPLYRERLERKHEIVQAASSAFAGLGGVALATGIGVGLLLSLRLAFGLAAGEGRIRGRAKRRKKRS